MMTYDQIRDHIDNAKAHLGQVAAEFVNIEGHIPESDMIQSEIDTLEESLNDAYAWTLGEETAKILSEE